MNHMTRSRIALFLTSIAFLSFPAVSARAEEPAPTTEPTPAKRAVSSPAENAVPAGSKLEKLFQESRRLFYRNDYEGSLTSLDHYFTGLLQIKNTHAKVRLRFAAVVAMGRIYLEQKQDPAGAIKWFEKIQKTHILSEAEGDIINGWISGLKDWIKLGKLPKDVTSEAELLELGQKYYESGLKKQKFIKDQTAAADFSIAQAYLVPFIVHYDKNPKIPEALYAMGDMRRRLWVDNEYWSENYYLTETIRRSPGAPIAMKAYEALNEDVHFGYTGTSGDTTPHSWLVLLDELKKLAQGKEIQKLDLKPSSTPAPVE